MKSIDGIDRMPAGILRRQFPAIFFGEKSMPAPRRTTVRKQLSGTLRADRQPRADFASRLDEAPSAPGTLAPAARPIWDQIAAIGVGIGVLTLADLPLLELLATTLHAEAEARAVLATEGLTIAAGSGGKKKHPAVGVAEAARGQALAMFRELGLTPRARQTIDTAPVAPATNPFLRHGRPPAD